MIRHRLLGIAEIEARAAAQIVQLRAQEVRVGRLRGCGESGIEERFRLGGIGCLIAQRQREVCARDEVGIAGALRGIQRFLIGFGSERNCEVQPLRVADGEPHLRALDVVARRETQQRDVRLALRRTTLVVVRVRHREP
jgi:hypothetical protein